MNPRTFSNIALIACAAFGIWANVVLASGPTCTINGGAPINCTTIAPILYTNSVIPTADLTSTALASNPYPCGYAPLPDGNTSLTACLVNPGGVVTDDIVVSGCDVGVYYGPWIAWTTTVTNTTTGASTSTCNTPPGTASVPYSIASAGGSVSGSMISGENYFGVMVNEAPVTVIDSAIAAGNESFSGIDNPAGSFDGVATPAGNYSGVGIFYLNGSTCAATLPNIGCLVEGNTITLPVNGKTGIEAKNPVTVVTIDRNAILGAGPDAGIAQNGIEIGDGARALIKSNTVGDNSGHGLNYTGTSSTYATGIRLYGGPGYENVGALMFEGPNYTVKNTVQSNILTTCDVGVFMDNNNTTLPVFAVTDNLITGNTISNNNTSPDLNIFSTAIMDNGGTPSDKITNNKTYGVAY